MEIQKQILLFFASLHNGFLDALVQLITAFGEEGLLIAFVVYIFWNVNKKKGFGVCMSLLSASTVMGIAKAIIRFPRPWMVIDGLDSVRMSTATGYSFPSGHTTNCSATFSSISRAFKKKWLSRVCAVVILLVGLSRMYLCVHWPLDVVGGLLIGCGASVLLYDLFSSMYDNKEKSIKIMIILGLVMTVIWVVIGILLNGEKVDYMAFEDLNLAFAILSGACLGYALERSRFDFDAESGSLKTKIIRFVIGMVGVVLILEGLKPLFVAVGIYNSVTRALRYFLIGFWACGVYPLLGRKLKLFV
ncbi:MAG: phosphatase PAP2 family protein [Sphaerochaetaceae bacterium]|nr:phosphatase PAP2 family protein [Sphaerochaetaceae bacterium]